MGDRHGCFNREPFKHSLQVQDGWTTVEFGSYDTSRLARSMKTIPFVMSRSCQHPERATDPRCAGCKWITQRDEHDGH